jgi:hypothetical protein
MLVSLARSKNRIVGAFVMSIGSGFDRMGVVCETLGGCRRHAIESILAKHRHLFDHASHVGSDSADVAVVACGLPDRRWKRLDILPAELEC